MSLNDKDRLALHGVPAASGRLPDVPSDERSEDQHRAAAQFEAVRGFAPVGPFAILLHSPALLNEARAMGDHLRYHAAIGPVLSELAILITAREWSQGFEWSVHAPIARAMGISDATIASIARREHPEALSDDEAIVYDFSVELLRDRQVSDTTFERAHARFGAAGVVDLTALHGYYGLLAMQLNVARFPAAEGGPALPG